MKVVVHCTIVTVSVDIDVYNLLMTDFSVHRNCALWY